MQTDGDFVDVILLYNHKLQRPYTKIRMWSHDELLLSSCVRAKEE
jgi:hypothetical protein